MRRVNLIKWVLLIPGFWLSLQLFLLMLGSSEPYGGKIVITEFYGLRNYFYMGYAAIFIALGLYILLKRTTEQGWDIASSKGILALFIPGLLLITFAYALAKLLYDVYAILSGAT